VLLELGAAAAAGRRLQDRVHAEILPGQRVGGLARQELHPTPADLEVTVGNPYRFREPSEQRVEPEQVRERLGLRRIRDRGDPDVVPGMKDAEEVASDAAESEEGDARHGVPQPSTARRSALRCGSAPLTGRTGPRLA
jgi:hypothetical protein